MYQSVPDLYCYPGSKVLRNVPGLRREADLKRFETAITAQRAEEPLPAGRFGAAHYRAVHRHLFQDVYAWAGRYRVVRIAKGDSMFCYPENIASEMLRLFDGLRRDRFLRGPSADDFERRAASFLATLNAIHPFRDGNGRTQLTFLVMLAHHADHPLDVRKLKPRGFLAAMVRSFHGDEAPLAAELRAMTEEE